MPGDGPAVGVGALGVTDGARLAGTVQDPATGSVETSAGRDGASIRAQAAATEPERAPMVAAIVTPPGDDAPVVVADAGKTVADTPMAKPRARPSTQTAAAEKRSAVVVAKVDRPAATSEPAAAAAAPPPPAPLPSLRILVEAETHHRAGTDRYTAGEYAAMLRNELIDIAAGHLGQQHVRSADANLAFRDDLRDGRAGIDRLCGRADAERLLLADLSVPSGGFSAIDSAYWPEVKLIAINCRDGRLHKSQKGRLEPSRLDRFEYQHGFAERSQRFVASQAYFLRP